MDKGKSINDSVDEMGDDINKEDANYIFEEDDLVIVD